MVSVYALGSTILAVFLMAWTRGWNKTAALIFPLAGLLIFNTLTAFSSHFATSLIYRFIAGMVAGLIWGVLTVYARHFVAPENQGKALAIAAVDQPVALAIGIPIATTLSSYFDWRLMFGFMSIISGLLIVWVLLGIQNTEGTKAAEKKSVFYVLKVPGISGFSLSCSYRYWLMICSISIFHPILTISTSCQA